MRRDKITKAEYDESFARLRERYPGLHFARNGAMHISGVPCLACDQETVDDYRRQQKSD